MSTIIEIKSKDNERIRLLRKLGQKKFRDKLGLFFVENLKIIEDNKVIPEMVFSVDKKILSKIDAKEKFLITSLVNKSFSLLDTPSGICAIYKKDESLIDFKERIVYLNGINDPGNLGTILRSALAFGFNNIILDEFCADLYNPKTINASKDAIFKLNFSFDKNNRVLNEIKKKMKVFATNLAGGKDPETLKNKKQFCIILGNEARGVDAKLLKLADGFIKIDMKGDIESLNVATSASIIFYVLS